MRIMTDLRKFSRLRWTKEITARYIITLECWKPARRPTVRLDKLSNLTAGSIRVILVAKNVWLVMNQHTFFLLVIDECAKNHHSCDVNAICQNIVESYNCTRRAGFYGNGRKCFGTKKRFNILFYSKSIGVGMITKISDVGK